MLLNEVFNAGASTSQYNRLQKKGDNPNSTVDDEIHVDDLEEARSVQFNADHSKAEKAKRKIQELEEDLECTDDDPCGYCKKCKTRGTLKVNEDVEPSVSKDIRSLENFLNAPRGAISFRKGPIKQITQRNRQNPNERITTLLRQCDKKLRWENSHAADVQPPRWLPDSSLTMEDEGDTLHPPSISKGDEVKVGKFKNSKATVKGFKKDDHNQPVLKTNKGDKKLFNLRLSKIQPK